MIRINLLPFRAARKKENIRRQVSIFFLLILFCAVCLVWYTASVKKEISSIKESIDGVKAQITQYKSKADRVTEIEKKLKILENKLKVIADLKSQRKKKLVLLDTMTGLVVPERMWLESLITNETTVTLKGVAFDNPTIADFMKNLEKSDVFSGVDLKRAKMKKINDSVMLKSFELLCQKQIAAAPETKQGKQKGSKK